MNISRTLFKYEENKYEITPIQKKNMKKTSMKTTNPKREYETYKLFIAPR